MGRQYGLRLRFEPFSPFYRQTAGLGVLYLVTLGLTLGWSRAIVASPVPPIVVAQTNQVAQANQNEDLNKLLREARDKVAGEQYAEAIALYNQAAQIQPDNARIFSGLAYCYTQLDRFAEAVTAFRQALSLDRNRTDAYLSLGGALEQTGDGAAAIETYRQLIALQPKEARAYDAAGAVLVRQQRFEEALPLLQKAAQLIPNSAGTQINLGITWIGLRNPEQGIQALEQALRLNPQDANIYSKLGEIFYATGQPDRAMEIYRQTLRLDPSQTLARQRIVEIFLAKPDYLRAIVNAELWIKQMPNDANAYRYLGLALQAHNRASEALEAWRLAKDLYQRQGNLQGVQDIDTLERSLRGR